MMLQLLVLSVLPTSLKPETMKKKLSPENLVQLCFSRITCPLKHRCGLGRRSWIKDGYILRLENENAAITK